MCLDAGAAPAAISFGNTIKKVSAIQRAFAAGVSMFAFDSIEELEKLARACARQPRVLPPAGREQGRGLAAVAQVRHHGGERPRADDPRRRDGHGPVRPVVPRRQPADGHRRLRGRDRPGRHAVHRPARRRGEPAHGEPGRRLPRALPRRGADGGPVRQRDHARHDRAFRQRPAGDPDRARAAPWWAMPG